LSQLELIHVVRRYGPVGGMERYVWELTRELAQLGHRVSVICERCHVEKPEGIAVYELGEIAPRPRWLSLLRFGRRVERFLLEHPHDSSLILAKTGWVFTTSRLFMGRRLQRSLKDLGGDGCRCAWRCNCFWSAASCRNRSLLYRIHSSSRH
jgi:hypothetical protein